MWREDLKLSVVQSEEANSILADKVAQWIESPCCFFLQGALGAGKTTFARSFIQAKGYGGHVPSPSYSLVQCYEALVLPIVHVDLYRLSGGADFEALGVLEWLGKAIWLIEWPERGASDWISADLVWDFDIKNQQRTLSMLGVSAFGQKKLQAFQGCD